MIFPTHHVTKTSVQVRALLYTATLTNAIMAAMGATEAAVVSALMNTGSQQLQHDAQEAYQQQIGRVSKPVHDALSLSGFSGKKWGQQQSGMLLCSSLTT